MNIHAHIPTALLRPFIKVYLIVESEDALVNSVLPDTSLVLAFRYEGRISCVANNFQNDLPASSLSGLRRSLRLFNYSKGTGNILVIFRETGATAFFKDPLHELFEKCISLDNFINHQQLSTIEEQLAQLTNHTQRINLIENFLSSKLLKHQPDELILTALKKIHLTQGKIKIKQLVQSLHTSQDTFEKRFRRAIGTSPKQYSSIIRMKSLTDKVQSQKTLTEIALEAGYFDQAHFNKDFKLFTGQTPTNFFKAPPFLQINDFLQ